MGRQAKPWQRAGRAGWWTKINGQVRKIGDTERQAWAELARIEARKGHGTAPGGKLSVPELVDLWLDHQHDHVRPKTYRRCRDFGESFARHCRTLKAVDLRPLHVRSWIKAHPTWDGQVGLAIKTVKQVTRWARREGWLESDPLQDVRGSGSRARKPPPDGAAERLMEALTFDDARMIVGFMLATGARPGEARTLEASRIVQGARGALVSGKRGERLVLIPEALRTQIRALCESRPSGPIFRNASGQPWSIWALGALFRRARARAGIEGIVPYSLRGVFASRAHAAGADGAVIAALLGHEDVSRLKILIKHYLKTDESKLREAVEGASRPGP